jgi:hypothetical protein
MGRKAAGDAMAALNKMAEPPAKPPIDPVRRKSLSHRLFDFVEHPLFTLPVGILGGIVGLVLYTPVLAICGVCVILAFHRAKVVTEESLWTQLLVYIVLSGMVVGSLWGLHLIIDKKLAEGNTSFSQLVATAVAKILPKAGVATPTTTPFADTSKSADTLSVKFLSELIDTTKNLERANLWVLYPSGYGDTVSPVSLYMFFNVTNRTSDAVSINSYSVMMTSNKCEWFHLIPIDSRVIQLLWGHDGLDVARTVDLPDSFNLQWDKEIPGHAAQYGTLLFDSPTYCDVEKDDKVTFRLVLVDSAGNTHTYVSDNLTVGMGRPNKAIGEEHEFQFHMTNYLVDASKTHRRMHCDPLPDYIAPEETMAGKATRKPGGPIPAILTGFGSGAYDFKWHKG